MKLTDKEIKDLIIKSRQGDVDATTAILTALKPLVASRSRAYFLIGGDRDDLLQEGMIGLYKAIRDFDINSKTPFVAFGTMCINRQVLSAVKGANRQKHSALNSFKSLDTVFDVVDESSNPEQALFAQQELEGLNQLIDTILTPYERQVARLFIQGKELKQIAKVMDKDLKSIDNAITRIKSKLKKCNI